LNADCMKKRGWNLLNKETLRTFLTCLTLHV